jgi:hypothetical protein
VDSRAIIERRVVSHRRTLPSLPRRGRDLATDELGTPPEMRLRAVENDGVSVLVDNGRRGREPAKTRKTAANPWEIDDGLWEP